MSKIASIVSYRNWVDSVYTTITPKAFDLSTNDWVDATVIDGYPLSNLNTRQLGQTYRMMNQDPSTLDSLLPGFEIDFGYARGIDVIALLNCNTIDKAHFGVSANGDMAIHIATSNDGVTWSGWSMVASPSDNITYRIAGAIAGVPEDGGDSAGSIVTRYLRVYFTWDLSDNFFEAGRLWIGDSIRALDGVDALWGMDFIDAGEVTATKGGQYYDNTGVRSRVLTCSYTNLPCLCAYGREDLATSGDRQDVSSFQGMQLVAGTTGDLIIVPRTDTDYWIIDTLIYGHLAHSFSIQRQPGSQYAVNNLVINEEH